MFDVLAFFSRPAPLGGLVLGAYLMSIAALGVAMRRQSVVIHVVPPPILEPEAEPTIDPRPNPDKSVYSHEGSPIGWTRLATDDFIKEAVNEARRRGIFPVSAPSSDRSMDDLRSNVIHEMTRFTTIINKNAGVIQEYAVMVDAQAREIAALEEKVNATRDANEVLEQRVNKFDKKLDTVATRLGVV